MHILINTFVLDDHSLSPLYLCFETKMPPHPQNGYITVLYPGMCTMEGSQNVKSPRRMDIIPVVSTLTLFLLRSVRLLGFLAGFHGDRGNRLGLHPGGCLSPFGSGLGCRRGCLLPRGRLGTRRRYQRRQGPTFGRSW